MLSQVSSLRSPGLQFMGLLCAWDLPDKTTERAAYSPRGDLHSQRSSRGLLLLLHWQLDSLPMESPGTSSWLWEWRNLSFRTLPLPEPQFPPLDWGVWTRWFPNALATFKSNGVPVEQEHFNITNDTFRECRRWSRFVYSVYGGGNLNSKAQAAWTQRVSAAYLGDALSWAPSLAGDGRQKARPFYSSLVHVLWPSLMGILTDMFDKHILLICVPKALAWA